MYQPKTGQSCHCKPGIQRDNCPSCEGTGQKIDFKAIREKAVKKCPGCMAEIWDVSTVDQRLNKCWECGLRFDNEEAD
jgi:hypothetical protein